jgi:hypothetical protein
MQLMRNFDVADTLQKNIEECAPVREKHFASSLPCAFSILQPTNTLQQHGFKDSVRSYLKEASEPLLPHWH